MDLTELKLKNKVVLDAGCGKRWVFQKSQIYLYTSRIIIYVGTMDKQRCLMSQYADKGILKSEKV